MPDARASGPTLSTAVRAVALRSAPLLIATASLTFVYLIFDPSGGAVIFVPVLLFAGLWLVLFAQKDRADHRAMGRIGEVPKNGHWTAVCGAAAALEDAPGEILACRFQVFDEMSGGSRSGGDMASKQLVARYDGFYLVPSGIDTGEAVVALKGFPDLVHLDKASPGNDILVRAKAAAWPCPRWLPKPVARELVLAGVGASSETCISYGDAPESASGVLKSWILRPGDPVCVFGRWRDGALYGSRNRPRGLPVYAGTADTVRQRLGGDVQAFLVLGGVLLTAALGLAVWTLL